MRDDVVILVPTGRRQNLECLLPHLYAAKDHFKRIELWMNATWEREDEFYVRELVHKSKGLLLLKDDGQWGVSSSFQHYGRYYRTLAQDNTLYIKIDDDILWMAPDAIKLLIDTRRRIPEPLLVVGNIVNNAYCNHKHQDQGAYDRTWDIREFGSVHNYNGEFAEFAHNTLLRHIHRSTYPQVYHFENTTEHGFRLPNHVYAFYGHDLDWDLDDEACPTAGKSSPDRPVLVAGRTLFAHYAYGEQIKYMDNTDIRARYRKEIPHEG